MANELNDEMWRHAMDGPPDLPDDGSGPPELEAIPTEYIRDGETPVMLQKIVTEVYVYTSLNQDDMWFGTKSFQDIHVLGEMRLADAMTISERRGKRKRK